MVLFFSVKGEGKCKKNKKKNINVSSLVSFLTIFGRKFAGKDNWEVFLG